MKEFKRELTVMLLLLLLIFMVVFTFIGCSEDSLEIQCNCQKVTTTKKIVNNRWQTIETSTFYSSFCPDDHKVINNNTEIRCN